MNKRLLMNYETDKPNKKHSNPKRYAIDLQDDELVLHDFRVPMHGVKIKRKKGVVQYEELDEDKIEPDKSNE